MSTTKTTQSNPAKPLDARVLSRIVKEGYGEGAWHGPDLQSALADVTPAMAFQRPAPGRHNIAEIALHHAWFARSVVSQLTGKTPEPFLLMGEDWFELNNGQTPGWPAIRAEVDSYQQQLVRAVTAASPVPEADRFDLVLGITCHAIYHAGQIQLIKRLIAK
jgi:hypothetical protein